MMVVLEVKQEARWFTRNTPIGLMVVLEVEQDV